MPRLPLEVSQISLPCLVGEIVTVFVAALGDALDEVFCQVQRAVDDSPE